MKRHVVTGLLVLGVCGQAGAGSAETLAPAALDVTRPASFSQPAGSEPLAYRRTPRRTPRRSTRTDWRERDRNPQGWLQIRGGGFDSEDVSKDDWTLGLKAVGHVAPTVRIGGSVDLMRRTNSDRTIVTEYVDAGGNTVRREVTTGESESNLVPLMAVAEVVFPTPGVQPYAGIAGGWEFLNVQAVDYASGIEYEADYDGPGWQIYAGVGLALAPRFQLSGEVFHNESTVERRVVDPFAGAAYDERIDVDGTGVRAGLNFAF